MSEAAGQKRTLFVRELADEVNKEILYAAFLPFGNIINIDMPVDKEKGTNRGIAFIEFEEEEDAKHAIFNHNESELYGRVIKVAYSTKAHVKQVKAATVRHRAVWHDDPTFGHELRPDDEDPPKEEQN
ncbi:Peptidyl-prolyl cis-trans isomerase E [Babesia sp. Xinjiang]|uniref:Peptidyl-prolyl cis-trans isomerase E n=1 Tax=Babesia sp. Xinjiang TaxID=462227 RepID=UPI000A22E42B|nr:Peptidyl-prolyl cis-trans isomerase E [Babesia sp. Xinjiang]ORM39804.1 Peptidyl-prolyl cis-trans isomerase E [Babesia sp. Xinjiang]